MPMENFTFVWEIKNFSYYWQKDDQVEIISPEFEFNNENDTSTWQLIFADRRVHDNRPISRNDKSVILYLHRVDFDGPDIITLNIKMSFVKADKSLFHWKEKRKIEETFQTNQIKSYLKISGKEILLLKRDELLIEDILIVHCKMWNNLDTLSKVEEQCLAHTLLEVGSVYFIAVVENFEDLIPGIQTPARIKSASVEESIFFMNVCLSDDRNLDVNIPIEANYMDLCLCNMFVLDMSGKWRKCGQDSKWRKFGEISEFALSLDYKTLMDKQNYSQKGVVTFKCEMTYTTEAEPRRYETIKYGLDSPEILQQMPSCVKNPPAPEAEKGDLKSPTTLKDDLVSLYKEGTLCDTKLCTETETFPAHRVVLSARSPVFKKMFTTDMREKVRDCVDIPDINADTVRKLLMFLYTDTVDDIEWQTAKELYFAADKYEIAFLKKKF